MVLRSLFRLPAIVSAFSLLGLFSGCSAIIQGWSQESYRSPEFRVETLTQKPLALLPVIILERPSRKTRIPGGVTPEAPYAPQTALSDRIEDNTFGVDQAYRVALGEMLLSKMRARRPALSVIPPNEVLKRLNDAGLMGAYSEFNRDFPRAGSTGALLKSFGSALSRRYVFITQAAVMDSASKASVNILWPFGRQSALWSVKFYGQIWDTVTGEQVWAGTGVGYVRLTAYEGSPLTEEVVSRAVDCLLDNIIPE